MLTVKAIYDNGTVKWEKDPHVSGLHNLIVVFEDVGENEDFSDTADGAALRRRTAIRDLQGMYEDIPAGISLADELVAERRQEARNV